jgi:hypothetical protein
MGLVEMATAGEWAAAKPSPLELSHSKAFHRLRFFNSGLPTGLIGARAPDFRCRHLIAVTRAIVP